jgi:signal transduction histidine kinase
MNGKIWRLLFIEDLPVYIKLVKKLLLHSGINFTAAQTLQEGIDFLGNEHFDAVILDLGLPDCQGIDTFHKLKQACEVIPIIIFSSSEEEDLALEALQSGAQDYLIKGSYLTNEKIGSMILNRSIAYAIERNQIQQELLRERSYLEERVSERTKELKDANARLQNLAASLVTAQENERKRISLELHDQAGQSLTALKLNLSLIHDELPSQSEALRNQIHEANMLTDTIMSNLRTLAHDLRPPSIDAIGLSQTLRDYCRKLARQTGIEIVYSAPEHIDLPSHIGLSLYRSIQEALTNIIKHANSSHVDIIFEISDEFAKVDIKDDGCGFSLPDLERLQSLGGIGLLGIRDRIEAIGGFLEIHTLPGRGTRIHLFVPR